jgi:hypothetical protein
MADEPWLLLKATVKGANTPDLFAAPPRPVAPARAPVAKAPAAPTAPPPPPGDLFATPVEVGGYTRKDGVFVAPHASTRQKRHEEEHHPDPANEVPEPIMNRLKGAIEELHDVKGHIDRVRESIDGPAAGGGGRYEADVLRNRDSDIHGALAFINKFRAASAANGTDAEAVLKKLGGIPDLAPSDKARGWMDDEAAELAKPAAPEPAAPPPPAPERFGTFTEAVHAASAKGPFTAADVAARWADGDAEEVLDQLHGHTDAFALLPDGEHWMRMQDYLDSQDPAEHLRDVQKILANGNLPAFVKDRMQAQARRLTDAALANARDGQEAPARDFRPDGWDDPSSPNYRYADTGHVAGSRKEMAAAMIKRAAKAGQQVLPTEIDWTDLEANPREAKDLITKSNLFGQVDWAKLREEGMDPGAGFLVDRIYAAIGQEPSEATPQARKDFAVGLQTLRARLESARTVDEVVATLDELRAEYDGKVLTAEESAAFSALRQEGYALHAEDRAIEKERDPLYAATNAHNSEIWKTEREIENRKSRGWAEKPELAEKLANLKERSKQAHEAWRQHIDQHRPRAEEIRNRRKVIYELMSIIETGAKIRNKVDNPLHRAWGLMGDRFVGVLRYRSHKGSDAFASHLTACKTGKVADWSWAEKEGATKAPRTTKESVRFQLTVPTNFVRTGGRNVTPESTAALKDTFGLRDVQSGNWVLRDQASAKWHTEQAAGAFADLADIIGAEDAKVAINGRLALAFGARGHGSSGFRDGAPRAHYEPVQRVINITKMKGGGSLGHEWWHAVDNIMAETEGGTSSKDAFVTVDPDLLPNGALKSAVQQLRAAMFDGPHRTTESHAYTDRDVKTAKHNVDSTYPSAVARKIKGAADVHAAVQAIDDHFAVPKGQEQTRRSKGLQKDWRRIAIAYHGGNPEGGSVDVKAGPAMSAYALNSARLDDGPTPYWSTAEEMSARAFQSYVEDRLAGQGRRNDYLSAFADNKYHQAKAYPEGEERERINAAFDAVFASMREARTLAKAETLLSNV